MKFFKKHTALLLTFGITVTTLCTNPIMANAKELDTQTLNIPYSSTVQDNNQPNSSVSINGTEYSQESLCTMGTQSVENILSTASVQDLNNFIAQEENIYENPTNNSLYETKIGVGTSAVGLAWIAAAEIASRAGYPCAARLIINSVNNKNYYESGSHGLFITKIKRNTDYRNWLKTNHKSFIFQKSHDSDLFYAIHNVRASKTSSRVHLHDTFDFKPAQYSGFTNIVNNWAWLCQHANVLHPIKVNIYINR